MEQKLKRGWVRGTCIGRGAYGKVNVGVNTSNGDVFAVKSVDLVTGLPSQVEALENEITILKSLSSPFIVKYLGDDTTSDDCPATSFRNLHMEYMPAGTAADLATNFSDEAAIANYTWCLVSALSYLHSRGIMHCDVKGKNVLLGSSPGTARLADFGSAVEIKSGGGVSGRGSPLWMAPEVIRGEYQGAESDVWSLGCTVIEMVTGKPGWGGELGNSVYRIGYSDELPLFPAQLSCLGIDFLEKCLRRDYTKRWSCDQLLQHPFISMSSRNNKIVYSSPRCVLDWFNSDSDREEDDNEIEDSEADERIRRLISRVEVNWEPDGWLVVRDRSEFDPIDPIEDGVYSSERWEDTTPVGSINLNLNLNLVLLPREQSYSLQHDVVAGRYFEPGHFNRNNVAMYEHDNSSVVLNLYITVNLFQSSKYNFSFMFASFDYNVVLNFQNKVLLSYCSWSL